MRISTYAADLAFPEGPLWIQGDRLVVTAMGTGEIVIIDTDRSRRTLINTGRPNGLALDRYGFLWVAESLDPGLLRIDRNGQVVEHHRDIGGVPLLWPNDLCFAPDGSILLTDSGIDVATFEGVSPADRAYQLPVNGKLFRFDPGSGRGEAIDEGIRFTNGLALSPNAETLYVAETLSGYLFSYPFGGDGSIGPRRQFCNTMQREPQSYGTVCGPDGMAVAADGSILVALFGIGELVHVGADGSILARIPLAGSRPTNIAFRRTDTTQAVVTECERGELLLVEDLPEGGPLFGGARF
jgi:gluconolactonase